MYEMLVAMVLVVVVMMVGNGGDDAAMVVMTEGLPRVVAKFVLRVTITAT